VRCDEGPRRRKRESKSNLKERILYGKGIDEEIGSERGGIERVSDHEEAAFA